MLIPASTPAHRRTSVLFQSLDWVDVDSGLAGLLLFLIGLLQFQSLDWVDVDSGSFLCWQHRQADGRFNPSTGLMFIPACVHFVVGVIMSKVSIPRLG